MLLEPPYRRLELRLRLGKLLKKKYPSGISDLLVEINIIWGFFK